jgi:methylmalonyl-CoA mutase cobalamin-binding domain/chain
MSQEEILEKLQQSIVKGERKEACQIAQRIIEKKIPIELAVEKLIKAMQIVDKKYEEREYFIVDVASSASAMREAFNILEPYLKVEKVKVKGKIVIGSLKGNIQSLGKDIVAATLRAAGFHVIDLGVDVAPESFVEKAVKENAQVIAISVSMDETTHYLREVVSLLQNIGLRGKIKTIVGGRAVSEKSVKEYGVDSYAKDAQECVKRVEELLK